MYKRNTIKRIYSGLLAEHKDCVYTENLLLLNSELQGLLLSAGSSVEGFCHRN